VTIFFSNINKIVEFWSSATTRVEIVCNLSLKVSVKEAKFGKAGKFPLSMRRQQISAAGFASPKHPPQRLPNSNFPRVQTAEIKLSAFRVKSINPIFPVRLHQESCARRPNTMKGA
jgi:hypothetical protein